MRLLLLCKYRMIGKVRSLILVLLPALVVMLPFRSAMVLFRQAPLSIVSNLQITTKVVKVSGSKSLSIPTVRQRARHQACCPLGYVGALRHSWVVEEFH